jgi:hypothetical protein
MRRSGDAGPLRAARHLLLQGHMEKLRQLRDRQEGKMGYILLWALGVPIPVLFLFYLLRGCT